MGVSHSAPSEITLQCTNELDAGRDAIIMQEERENISGKQPIVCTFVSKLEGRLVLSDTVVHPDQGYPTIVVSSQY